MQNLASHFAILGLTPGASVADVRAAHKRLVVLCHPDRVTGNPTLRIAAEEHTKRLNAARDEILRPVVVEEAIASSQTSADTAERVGPVPPGTVGPSGQQKPLSSIQRWIAFLALYLVGISILAGAGISVFERPAKPEPAKPKSDLAAIEKICVSDIMNARSYIDNPQEDVLVALRKYAVATERLAVEAEGLFYRGMSFGIVVREYSDTLNKVYSFSSSVPLPPLSRMDATLPPLLAKMDALRARMMEFASGSPSAIGVPHSAIRPSLDPRTLKGRSARAS
jgi:hypothetical protein